MPENDRTPHTPPEARQRSKKQLFYYAFALLSVALFLLVFSYVMHMRSSEQQITTLEQERSRVSVSAIQSIQQLTEENEMLKIQESTQRNEISALEAELDSRKKESDALLDRAALENGALSAEADRSAALSNALEAVWYLSRAYNRRDYDEVASILEYIEATVDVSLLPDASPGFAGGSDKSPLKVYNEIKEIMENR